MAHELNTESGVTVRSDKFYRSQIKTGQLSFIKGETNPREVKTHRLRDDLRNSIFPVHCPFPRSPVCIVS